MYSPTQHKNSNKHIGIYFIHLPRTNIHLYMYVSLYTNINTACRTVFLLTFYILLPPHAHSVPGKQPRRRSDSSMCSDVCELTADRMKFKLHLSFKLVAIWREKTATQRRNAAWDVGAVTRSLTPTTPPARPATASTLRHMCMKTCHITFSALCHIVLLGYHHLIVSSRRMPRQLLGNLFVCFVARV